MPAPIQAARRSRSAYTGWFFPSLFILLIFSTCGQDGSRDLLEDAGRDVRMMAEGVKTVARESCPPGKEVVQPQQPPLCVFMKSTSAIGSTPAR